MGHQSHLPIGYMLQEYKIESVLGQGGFGITYLATDINLDKEIVIKEFFPKEFSSRMSNIHTVLSNEGEKSKTYKYLLKKFLSEAKILASLTHPNIVKVTRFFEANNTAYFIMDYIKGESLKSYISENGTLSQEDIKKIIIPVLEGLKTIHNKSFLHRDIAPDNIYLTQYGVPMLIDFGSAKNIIGNESKSLATIVKAGYSAPEQYILSSIHTESTDIYATGAVIVTMITGKAPPEATKRQLELYSDMPDPLETILAKYKSKYNKSFLEAISKAMSIKNKDRFQNVEEFQEALILLDENDINTDTYTQIQSSNYTVKKKRNNIILIILSIIFFVALGILYKIFFLDNNNNKSIKNVEINEDKNTTSTVIDKESKIKETNMVSEEENKSIKETDLTYYNYGLIYYKGEGVEENKSKAIEFFKKACELNNTKSCTNLGIIYDNGKEIEKDKTKAVKFYKKACDLNGSVACSNLGYMYDKGDGITKNDSFAIRLYQKACYLNDAQSCFNLGIMYQSGDIISKDSSKSLKLYKKACNLGHEKACSKLK